MKYQYIYGRAETGYGVIQSSDDGRYTSDERVAKALNCPLEQPEKCPLYDTPEPLIFINNAGDKNITALGRSKLVFGARTSKLDHFYIFDENDKRELFEDVSKIFNVKNFVRDVDEAVSASADATDIFGESRLEPAADILTRFNISDETFKSIIAAMFEVSTGGEVYFITKDCGKGAVRDNEKLIWLLYTLLPKRITERLGFITYLKRIPLNAANAISSGIKIRFIEDNSENKSMFSAVEKRGGFIFDLSGGYVSELNNIKDNLFLEFFTSDNFYDTEDLKNFYKILNDYKNNAGISLNVATSLFDAYNAQKKGHVPSFDSVKILIGEYKNFGGEMKNYFKNEILPEICNMQAEIKDYIRLLLDAYGTSGELKDFALDEFGRIISGKDERKALEALSVMKDDRNKELSGELQKMLLTDKRYLNGGLLLIEESLRPIQDNPFKIISLFQNIIGAAPDMFNYLDEEKYFLLLKEKLRFMEPSGFKSYAEKFRKLIINAHNTMPVILYKRTCYFYFTDCMRKISNTKDLVDTYFNLFETIGLFDEKEYHLYYEKIFKEVPEALSPKDGAGLIEIHYLMCKTDDFVKAYPEAGALFDICVKILNAAFSGVREVSPEWLERLDEWPEAYINLITSVKKPIYRQLEAYRAKNEAVRLFNENAYDEIKVFYMKHRKDSLEEVNEMLKNIGVSWLENHPHPYDYTILPYMFHNDIRLILNFLPDDNVKPWLDLAQNVKYMKAKPTIFKEIMNRPKLKKQYGHLSPKKTEFLDIPLEAENSRKIKSSKSGEVKFLLFYLCTGAALFAATFVRNSIVVPKESFGTALFNVMSSWILAAVFFASGFFSERLKRSKNFFPVVLAPVGAALLVTVAASPVFTNDRPNSTDSYIKFYKAIYCIANDTEAPVITLLNPIASDGIISAELNNKLVIEYEISEPEATVTAVFDGKLIEISDNKVEIDTLEYGLGTKTLIIRATDAFENKGELTVDFNVEKPSAHIKLEFAALKTTYEEDSENVETLNGYEHISLSRGERLSLQAKIDCSEKTASKITINGELSMNSEIGSFKMDLTDRLRPGRNDVKLTVEEYGRADNKKEIELSVVYNSEPTE